MIANMKAVMDNVRNYMPLVHNITNYVTVNDCANIIIACGGSPIMADEIEEVEEITSICNALNINMGTLNSRTVPAMIMAGKKANELGHPVIFDPVGVGASTYRKNTAEKIIREVKISIIRGNFSEIKALRDGGKTKGVDANDVDVIDSENIDEIVKFCKAFSKETGAVIIVTGVIDIVADENKAFAIKNGHYMMSKISGTGCMLSALLGAFAGANPDNLLEASLVAVALMGLCGELAYEKLEANEGNLAYKNKIFDEMFHMNGEKLETGAKYEIK